MVSRLRPPVKRSGVRAKRGPRRREAPQEGAAWWEGATRLLWGRSGGRCECCNTPLGGSAERHHRQRRREGGDRLANLLLLSPSCHAYWTAHPGLARDRGIIVSSYAADPGAVPVLYRGSTYTMARWVVLGDDGGMEPWTPPPGVA